MGVKIFIGEAEDRGHIINGMHVTIREIEALSLLAMGLDNGEIAKKLGVGVNTIRNHIYNASQKLGAKHRAHAVALAIEKRIFEASAKDEISWVPDRYHLCLMCGRTLKEIDWNVITGQKTTINHVECQLPDEILCSYTGCNGTFGLSVDWEKVRDQYPEYPKTPKRGVVYEYDWSYSRK